MAMKSPTCPRIERDLTETLNHDSDSSGGEDEGMSIRTGNTSDGERVHVEVGDTGIVFLPETSCRAVYKAYRHPKGTPAYDFFRAETCTRRFGGYHSKLMKSDRAPAGYYQGMYSNGTLEGALEDTMLTKPEVEKLKDDTRMADRALTSVI